MGSILRQRRWSASAVCVLAGLLAAVVACAACGRRSGEAPETRVAPGPPDRIELDLFALGRVLGTVAPCGCTSDPLGGIQYLFGVVEGRSQPTARVVVGPGSFLFPDADGAEAPTDDAAWAQADRRAEVLTGRFSSLGSGFVLGLGPHDLGSPSGEGPLHKHELPRVLSNGGTKDIPAHRLVSVDAGGRTFVVGVTAAVDPTAPKASLLGTLDPVVPAVQAQVEAMRAAGAQLTVAVIEGTRALAEEAARSVEGLDVAVVAPVQGAERGRVGAAVAKIGGTYLVEPGDRLQTVTHLRLSLDPGVESLPSAASWALQTPGEQTREELARVEQRLEKFRGNPKADPAFVARLEQERARLQEALAGTPAGEVMATFEQVRVTCRGSVDEGAASALKSYDAWVSEQNRKLFAGKHAPAPGRGQASYSGIEECDMCHSEAVEFWRTTVHARAYKTLVDDNKQFDLSCVGCHVTGYRKPGGSEVVENEDLRDVQCEVCHGPGSIHVGDEKPGTIVLEAAAEVCLQCHTPDHSDTFDYEPYLRDVLGPGHGAEARAKLGEGPTGANLRAAAVDKAGGSCKKM